LKTAVLLAGLTALVLAVGQRLGGPQGLVLAGFLVVVMNFGAYWFSDRIALAMHGAQELGPHDLPWVREMVADIARRAGLPMPRLYLIPLAVPNAFATGRNPSHAAVAVTHGLLELMDKREVRAVLAHELAHVRNRDTLISTVAATLAGVISYAAQMLSWAMLFGRGGDRDEEGSGLEQLALILIAPIAATLLQLAVSRSREYGADATGAAFIDDPEALASALSKLDGAAHQMPYDRAPATAHLFIVNPLSGHGVMKLFSTHPPVEERIRRLRDMARAR
jgi:heat shock protein HtpX